eukprot:Sspe_Gene.48694::Locus_25564_Transcript_1_2_Confidence_1.000_Length_1755::g.48694::m.48694
MGAGNFDHPLADCKAAYCRFHVGRDVEGGVMSGPASQAPQQNAVLRDLYHDLIEKKRRAVEEEDYVTAKVIKDQLTALLSSAPYLAEDSPCASTSVRGRGRGRGAAQASRGEPPGDYRHWSGEGGVGTSDGAYHVLPCASPQPSVEQHGRGRGTGHDGIDEMSHALDMRSELQALKARAHTMSAEEFIHEADAVLARSGGLPSRNKCDPPATQGHEPAGVASSAGGTPSVARGRGRGRGRSVVPCSMRSELEALKARAHTMSAEEFKREADAVLARGSAGYSETRGADCEVQETRHLCDAGPQATLQAPAPPHPEAAQGGTFPLRWRRRDVPSSMAFTNPANGAHVIIAALDDGWAQLHIDGTSHSQFCKVCFTRSDNGLFLVIEEFGVLPLPDDATLLPALLKFFCAAGVEMTFEGPLRKNDAV